MFKKNLNRSLIALAVLSSFGAQADIRINGFANFNAGMMTNDDESLYGYGDDVNFNNDSLFAIQISGDISDKMTATAQILARGDNDYDADFEWAYVAYEADNDITITAGRFRMPLFAYSASLDVGYSYHWIAAPDAVYNVPFRNMDGLKVEKRFSSAGIDYRLDLSHGSVSGEILGTDLSIDNTTLLSFEATDMTWTARIVYGQGDVSLGDNISSDPTLDLVNGFVQGATAYGFGNVAADIQLLDDTGTFAGASLNYDNGEFFAGAEYTQQEVEDSFSSQDDAYYITAGYRFGKWTTALTYEHFESDGDVLLQEELAQLGSIDAQSALLAQLGAGLQAGQLDEYDTTTVTVRYEAATRTAVTLESNFYDNQLFDDTATLVRLGVSYVF